VTAPARPSERKLRAAAATRGSRPAADRRPRPRKWAPHSSGARLGFLSVELASGLILNDLRLMTGKNGHWIAMPAGKLLVRDGNPRLDVNDKPIFSQLIEFRDGATADRFNEMVIALVRAADPTLSDGAAR
jgi:DNA-binding cell septation regulator SpoVG